MIPPRAACEDEAGPVGWRAPDPETQGSVLSEARGKPIMRSRRRGLARVLGLPQKAVRAVFGADALRAHERVPLLPAPLSLVVAT